MSVQSATRTIGGVELPAPGIWKLDPGHAEIGFVGRHFMLTKVRGRFTVVDATIEIADAPGDSHVEATIDMASVASGDEARDGHLRSPDFFDVESWPTASFRLGAKGVGEAGTIGATPAIQNAVIDAVSHLGVRHIDLPLTAERVWRAIQEATL